MSLDTQVKKKQQKVVALNERNIKRREKLSDYLFDMSKLVFSSCVLTLVLKPELFVSETPQMFSWYALAFAIAFVVIFSVIATCLIK